jgi:hypothetical protein
MVERILEGEIEAGGKAIGGRRGRKDSTGHNDMHYVH